MSKCLTIMIDDDLDKKIRLRRGDSTRTNHHTETLTVLNETLRKVLK